MMEASPREPETRRLLVLCHHGDFEHLLQATSAAATAAGAGWYVDMVFYFDALARLLADELDEVDPGARAWSDDPPQRVEEAGIALPSSLLDVARDSGRTRIFACSASLRLLEGVDREEGLERIVGARVDEVVGWPTVLEVLSRADRALYL